MAPGGVEPPHTDSKSVALSTELRGLAASVPDRGCGGSQAILCSLAVAVAQLVEPRVVVPVVGGSSPLRHPSRPRGASLLPIRGISRCKPQVWPARGVFSTSTPKKGAPCNAETDPPPHRRGPGRPCVGVRGRDEAL